MGPPESEAARQEPLEFSCVVAPKINLALQQNAVPVIRELFLANNTDRTLDGLLVRVEAQPQFCFAREWTIDRLLANSRFTLADVKLDLSQAFLAELREWAWSQLSIPRAVSRGSLESASGAIHIYGASSFTALGPVSPRTRWPRRLD